jgi:hypothetical protein
MGLPAEIRSLGGTPNYGLRQYMKCILHKLCIYRLALIRTGLYIVFSLYELQMQQSKHEFI